MYSTLQIEPLNSSHHLVNTQQAMQQASSIEICQVSRLLTPTCRAVLNTGTYWR
jgi:hypothetical protein